jgi:hypothetical protein
MQAIAVTACIAIVDCRPLARMYCISPDRQGRESRQACRLNASARTRRSKTLQRDATRVSEKGIILNFMKDCIAPNCLADPGCKVMTTIDLSVPLRWEDRRLILMLIRRSLSWSKDDGGHPTEYRCFIHCSQVAFPVVWGAARGKVA